MPHRCCPACRLLQRGPRCVDCRADTAALDELLRAQIAGLTRIARPPPRGWRDRVALWTTALGMLGSGIVASVLIDSPAGMLVMPAVGAFGYSKQFWRAAFKRRPRLTGVPPRARPPGVPLVGIARPFERTLATGAIAIATIVENRQGVLLRAIDAAPFWLVIGDRRVLVTGACWLAGAAAAYLVPMSVLLRELVAGGFPIDRASRAGLRVARIAVMPGDRVAVLGPLRDETVAGLGGYRDSLTETIRGEPGAPIWIDRLDGVAPEAEVRP